MPTRIIDPFIKIENGKFQNKLDKAWYEYIEHLESIFYLLDTEKLFELLDFIEYPKYLEREDYHHAITNILRGRGALEQYDLKDRKKYSFKEMS